MLQNLFRSYFARFMYPLAQAFVLNKILRGILLCLPFWLYDIALTGYVRHNSFFWDTVQLASEHGHFFYENGFSTLLLPDNIDSGHPPFFGMYIAFCWKLFGKSLIVSHLSMLPFLLGITWQAMKLGEKILGEWQTIFLILIVKINPIIAGQSVLVTPDTPLLFCLLMALNSIFNEKTVQTKSFSSGLLMAILGLSMISMRGMMLAAAIYIFQIYQNFSLKQLNSKRIGTLMLPYLLGGLCTLSFLSFHYFKKGWIGYFAGSRWAEAFQVVDFQGFIKNCLVIGWRFIDAGHLFLWAVIFICLFILNKKQGLTPFKNTGILITLLVILIITLSPTLVIYKGLLQHRYLMPIYLVINILCLKLISDLKSGTFQNALYGITFLGLFSGHFWIYQQPIATSWDTTLAHLPYYRLRKEMIQYIDDNHIPINSVGSAYPNINTFENIDLNGKEESFPTFNFNQNDYIFYSNVMNDFNENELDELKNHWQIVKILREGQVEVVLLKRKTMERFKTSPSLNR